MSDLTASTETNKSQPKKAGIKTLKKRLQVDAKKLGKETAKNQIKTLEPVLGEMKSLSREEQQKLGDILNKDLEGPQKKAFDPLALPPQDQPIVEKPLAHKASTHGKAASPQKKGNLK